MTHLFEISFVPHVLCKPIEHETANSLGRSDFVWICLFGCLLVYMWWLVDVWPWRYTPLIYGVHDISYFTTADMDTQFLSRSQKTIFTYPILVDICNNPNIHDMDLRLI